MIKACRLGLVAVFLSVTPALADPAPIKAYATLPSIQDPRLSPDGTSLAMVAPVGDHQALVTRKLDGSGTVVLSTGETDPDWFHWKSDSRLMASLRFTAYSANNEYTLHTRLLFIDTDPVCPRGNCRDYCRRGRVDRI